MPRYPRGSGKPRTRSHAPCMGCERFWPIEAYETQTAEVSAYCMECRERRNRPVNVDLETGEILDRPKTCLRCMRQLDRSEFGRNPRTRDGLATWCKECHRNYTREYRERHRSRYDP